MIDLTEVDLGTMEPGRMGLTTDFTILLVMAAPSGDLLLAVLAGVLP